MSYKLIVKDAFWQILWRILSALWWFLVLKIITPYLGPLRFWDYNTILKYFAIWSAFADFWLYVFALKTLGEIKNKYDKSKIKCDESDTQDVTSIVWNTVCEWIENTQDIEIKQKQELEKYYSKFVTARLLNIVVIYVLALIIAFFIPSYTNNPYILRWLPFWMLFSASFMFAWIVQLPLQLFWQMKHLSISLTLSRIAQLLILVGFLYTFFANPGFETGSIKSIIAFQLILFSVFMSWFVQFLYVYFVGKKYLNFKLTIDRDYEKYLLKTNWKYGLAYYISSFHTLIVTILLSILYPTINWYKYAWIWALSLSLIEILLIVPSALWNSSIHKIASYEKDKQLVSFWNLMIFIIWIWFIFLINFTIFSKNIIYFIWGEKFLSNISQWTIWSDFILPFLAFVLLLSFIKQIFNYIFVATSFQNKLLKINGIWVLIWTIIWIPLLIKYNIIWWIITQTLLEILFAGWAVLVAINNNIFPKINKKHFAYILWLTLLIIITWVKYPLLDHHNIRKFFAVALVVNIIYIGLTFKLMKNSIKNI